MPGQRYYDKTRINWSKGNAGSAASRKPSLPVGEKRRSNLGVGRAPNMLMAATNKCLAQSNKSCMGGEATKKRAVENWERLEGHVAGLSTMLLCPMIQSIINSKISINIPKL